jgi:hypothetical protein
MRNIVRVIGVSLAAMAGSLMVAGVAWAQAVETPITVQIYDCEPIEDPERREWVDEDGIVHVRDNMQWCRVRRGMVGTITGWASWDIDPAAGHWFERAYYAFSGWVLDELTTGVGRYTGEGNRIEGVWTYTGNCQGPGKPVKGSSYRELSSTRREASRGRGRVLGDRSGVLAEPKSRHSVNQEPIEDAVVCPTYGAHAATCPTTGSMSGTGITRLGRSAPRPPACLTP